MSSFSMIDLLESSALKSVTTTNHSTLNEDTQHLVFRGEDGGVSMIQRTVKPKKSKDKKTKSRKEKKDKPAKTALSTTLADSMETQGLAQGTAQSFVIAELRKVAPEDGTLLRTYPTRKMKGIFSEWTKEQMKAYDKDAIAAIRSRDVELMRTWHEAGRPLQVANSFGESLLHMACRRGFLEVVQFLVDDCGHDLWIRDDMGRTILHDACWTPVPSPELVDYILAKDCDMLLVMDKRGHAPLDYARKDHWEFWIEHFGKKDLTTILPKRDIFYMTSDLGSEAKPLRRRRSLKLDGNLGDSQNKNCSRRQSCY